jgi:hypothetical protein
LEQLVEQTWNGTALNRVEKSTEGVDDSKSTPRKVSLCLNCTCRFCFLISERRDTLNLAEYHVLVRNAAYHESAHAVVAVALGLPLWNKGMHIDTRGDGITYTFHRTPGTTDVPSSVPNANLIGRQRSILMIKAGFLASLKVDASYRHIPETAINDRDEQESLLHEMYVQNSPEWTDTDKELTAEAQRLVDLHWDAIRTLAEELLAQPVVLRTAESNDWASPDRHERRMSGSEVAAVLTKFHFQPLVRSASDGLYLPPDLYP